MSKNLRFGYAVKSAFFLLSATTLAVPTRARQNKRQLGENSSSFSQSITDAVSLDKSIKDAQNNSDDDGDSVDEDEEDNNASATASTLASTSASVTSVADTSPSTTGAKSQLQTSGGSFVTRDVAIVGGTIGGLIFLALIGFALYRWRASKKNNQGPWNYEKYPTSGPMYQIQQKTIPSILSGGHGENSVGNPAFRRNELVPTMPKPLPLVLIPRSSEKHSEDNQTFLLDRDSNGSNLPSVYEEMRSPSQDSSISQTVPYPNRNAATRRKLYASFQPPPIPESPKAELTQSRFSWTTRSARTSIDSAPQFRTVSSWVNHQTNRPSMKEKLAGLRMKEEPSVPPTPVEFRHHPGAPVSFLAQHGRQESVELDKQFMHGR